MESDFKLYVVELFVEKFLRVSINILEVGNLCD